MNFYYINANIDGQRRWHLVADKEPGLYFVAADFEEEEYGIEEYMKDFPDNEVIKVPNAHQIKHPLGICELHSTMHNRVDCPLCDFLFVYDRLNLALGVMGDCLFELSNLPDVEDKNPEEYDEISRGRVCIKLEKFLEYARIGQDGPCTCDEIGESRCPKHGLENLAEELRSVEYTLESPTGEDGE